MEKWGKLFCHLWYTCLETFDWDAKHLPHFILPLKFAKKLQLSQEKCIFTPKIVRAWHQLDPLFPAPDCVQTSFILFHKFSFLFLLDSQLAHPVKAFLNTDPQWRVFPLLKHTVQKTWLLLWETGFGTSRTLAAASKQHRTWRGQGEESSHSEKLPLSSAAATATSAGRRLQWSLSCENKTHAPKLPSY